MTVCGFSVKEVFFPFKLIEENAAFTDGHVTPKTQLTGAGSRSKCIWGVYSPWVDSAGELRIASHVAAVHRFLILSAPDWPETGLGCRPTRPGAFGWYGILCFFLRLFLTII